MSGIVSSMRFRERAYQIKICYEKIQEIITEFSSNHTDKSALNTKYYVTLSQCENHTDSDYFRALCITYLTSPDKSKITPHPTRYIWIIFVKDILIYYFFIICLYALPIIIFISL